MIQVEVIDNVLSPGESKEFTSETLSEFLKTEMRTLYPTWPGARIYHERVDREHEVTPANDADLEYLDTLTGKFLVVVFPKTGDPVTSGLLLFGAATAVRGLVNLIEGPATKKNNVRRIRQGSPNNTIGNRENGARLLERIPDIYGRARVYPDLIQVPYVFFKNHIEHHVSYMCIGRGTFEVFDVREGETKAQDIPNMSVRIYPPGQAPGGGTPQSPTIGADITDPALVVIPVKGVKGEVLLAFNQRTCLGEPKHTAGAVSLVNARFLPISAGVGQIHYNIDQDAGEVTDKIAVGDELHLNWDTTRVSITGLGITPGIGSTPNLATPDAGPYLVCTAINTSVPGFVQLTVSIPAAQQAQWDLIATTYNPGPTPSVFNQFSALTPITGYVAGPFFCNDSGTLGALFRKVSFNFVAERGLFADDGTNQSAISVHIEVGVIPCDTAGTELGPAETTTIVLKGSTSDRTTRAVTGSITPSFSGPFKVWARRVTPSPWRQEKDPLFPDYGFGAVKGVKGLVEDTVRWTHCYSIAQPPNISFGDITTVHVMHVARKDSRQVDSLKFNMLVGRQIQTWDGVTFGGLLTTTASGENVLFSILKDSRLGNLPDAQIDFAGIAAAFESVRFHFQETLATDFHATFDEDTMSLEEMIAAVSDCCFVTVYREGNLIKASAEIDTDTATVVFNHRNKIIDSEERNVRFATEEEYSGIEVEYVDQVDERIKTYFVPKESTQAKYRKLTKRGLRTETMAAWHAWRAYYKLLHQDTFTSFEACEEAALTVINDKILVADNTRAVGTEDGEIISVSGTTVGLSQPAVTTSPPYTIFLQHTDGTIEAIAVTSFTNFDRAAVLASAPSAPLVTDDTEGVRTKYVLVPHSEVMPTEFLVTEKEFDKNGTYRIAAVNYSAMFYAHEGLKFWHQFAVQVESGGITTQDSSPYRCPTTVNGGGTFTDDIRGTVWRGTLNSHWFDITIPNPFYTSYTKMAWLRRTALGSLQGIMGTPSSDEEVFALFSDDLIAGHHGSTDVLYPNFPVDEWHHAAVIFDEPTGVMILMFDGEEVDRATGITESISVGPRRVWGINGASNGYVGRGDNLRFYERALSVRSVREIYHKERIQ